MKKILLLVSILSSFYFVSAQVCNVIPLGWTPNAIGSSGGANKQLSYDKDLNTVAFIHNMMCDADTTHHYNAGFFTYDISTDGGTTWNINQPPVYGPVSTPTLNCVMPGSHPGFYPKGMIFNPAGNTNPASAHLAYTGFWNGIPGGKLNGTGHFDLSAPNENYDILLTGKNVSVEDIFITKTGESWIVGKLTGQSGYQDTIAIFKGTWNGSDFVYTYFPVQYLVNPDVGIWDMRVAFSDDGETGYIAIVTNQDINHTHFVNSSSYIQVLKTEDGGQTWSCPADLDIQTALDSALKNQGNSIYQSTFNINIVIDANENLHIIAHIVEYISPGVQLSMPYGEHGMFDLYTTDGGTTYLAQLLAHPQTSYASFGTAGIDEIIEFSRQFASRSWDGSKLFFGWFDSDTAVYPFPFFNSHPDLRLVGFDVNTNTWTTDLSNLPSINGGENITIGSSAHQKCTFGTGSYYSIDNAGTYSIPVTYMVVSGNGTYTSQPCDFFFIDCAAPTGNFIYSGHPLPVPVLHLSTLCDGGNGVVLSINEKSKDLIVSSNYPNPFTGKTSVDVTLPKAGDVSVEISNVVGQKLVSATYQNLHSGLNTLTLDASSLAHGLYFFTVKAGSKSVTKTMTVE